MNPWKFTTGNDNTFFLRATLRGVREGKIADDPAVAALHEALGKHRKGISIQTAEGEIAAPDGPLGSLSGWRGNYRFSERTAFRVTDLTFVDAGMLLECSGSHDPRDVEDFLNTVVPSAPRKSDDVSPVEVDTAVEAIHIAIEALKDRMDADDLERSRLKNLVKVLTEPDHPDIMDFRDIQKNLVTSDFKEVWELGMETALAVNASYDDGNKIPLGEMVQRTMQVVGPQQLEEAWVSSLGKNLNLMAMDEKFRALPRDVWLRVLAESDIESIQYEDDFFDCDDFAFQFKAECSRKFRLNGCGLVVDVMGKRAYVALLTIDPLRILFFEPKPDEPNKLVENSETEYQFTPGYCQF